MSIFSSAAVQKLALYGIVSITGAAVMVIELLGTRVVAPFYGISIYVWSSLISVTMIALATGYFLGGRWADARQHSGLSLIVALAGLFTLVIPWAARPVLLLTDPLGLRGGAFLSALILFSPALICLGMVGPFAIKLATRQLDKVGSSAGSIYAVSTLGSVLGTLILGFYLFPLIGSREILIATGLALSALAAAIMVCERLWFSHRGAVSVVMIIALGLAVLPKAIDADVTRTDQGTYTLRSAHESLYGWVRVFERPKDDLRLLMSDASTIGAASMSTFRSRLTYQQIVPILPAMVPAAKRALLIGLGAGHMVGMLKERHGITTDTIEIDPAVATAAEDYFGFKPTGTGWVGDARYEIRHLQGPYDIIIHDCFTGGSEPAHLLTVETLSQLRSLLTANGILVLNFVAFAEDGHNAALAAVSRTLREVFPEQQVLISEPGREFNDFVFLASRQPIDPTSAGLSADEQDWLKSREFKVNAAHGVVLTDNFNPLEKLQTRKAEHYRKVMVDWFGTDMLLR